MKLISIRFFAIVLATAAVVFANGCASDSQAGKAAGQGATMGAVGGAATGAVAGSMADSAAKEKAATPAKPDPKVAELRQRIGDRNYASALLLAQCKHRDAIASAEETLAATQDRQQRTYAMLIQGIAAEESGDKALASSIYPKIVQEDPK